MTGVIGSVRHLARLFAIARTLARHDALFPLEMLGVAPALTWAARQVSRQEVPGRRGERLGAALQELGPSFIKVGQLLSVRPDLVGEEIAHDLSNLQDSLPAFSGDAARAAIKDEFDESVDTLFEGFDDKAVAAASIAQVHFAATTDGRDVAVKVLRPGIEEVFAADMALAQWLAEWVERTQPSLRRLRPVEVVRTLADSVAIEMDLRLEAAAASELAENTAGDAGFRVPAVDWQRTGRRVLTVERIDGIPIDERDALIAAGHDPGKIVEQAAEVFFNQVFRDGFFHADMHPGNLFVDEDGIIVAVDFGIMGRLDRQTRRTLAEMLLGFLTRDYGRVADVHFEAGYVPKSSSRDLFMQACRSIGEPIFERPLNEISLARLLAQLFRVTEQFGMETQPQLLMLQKTMLMTEGIGRALTPGLNIWEIARPLIEEWSVANLGPQAKIMDGANDAGEFVQRMPGMALKAEKLVNDLTSGGLKLHPDTVEDMARQQAARTSRTLRWLWFVAAIALFVAVIALID